MTEHDKKPNQLRKFRESHLISKSELGKKAGLSVLTIHRIENGKPCRMETKRKILMALGLGTAEKDQIFPD